MSLLFAQYYFPPEVGRLGLTTGQLIALVVPIVGAVVVLIALLFIFAHLRRSMAHAERMLAIEKGFTDLVARTTPGGRRPWFLVMLLVPLGALTAATAGTAIVLEYTRPRDDVSTGEIRAQLEELVERAGPSPKVEDLRQQVRVLNARLAERSQRSYEEPVIAIWICAGVVAVIAMGIAADGLRRAGGREAAERPTEEKKQQPPPVEKPTEELAARLDLKQEPS